MADDFEQDDFEPEQPVAATDDFEADDFEPDATAAPREGFLTGVGMALPRQVARTAETMASAGEPGVTLPRRLGRAGLGLLEYAQIPFSPFMEAGKRVAQVKPELTVGIARQVLPGFREETEDITGGAPLTPEQTMERAGEVGETIGGMAGPVAYAKPLLRAARGLRGAVRPPLTELPPATPVAPRAPIPSPVVAPAPTGPQATLAAAEEFATGRQLDLGTVGQRRALQRNQIQEAVEPGTPADAKPLTEPTVAAPPVAEPAPIPTPKAKRGQGTLNLIRRATATDTPSDFAKGIPEAEELVTKVQDHAVTRRILEEDLVQEVADIYRPLGKKKARVEKVNRVLDTEGGDAIAAKVLNPAELKVYTQMRQWFDKLADAMGIEPGKRITDYFPRMREQLGVQEKKVVLVGGKEVPTYVTDLAPNRIVRELFEKPRTSAAPADNLTLDPILVYAHGASRKIAYGGGKHPVTGESLTPLLDDIKDLLPAIPDDKASYFADYVNDVIGVPHRGKPTEWSRKMIEANKALRRRVGVDVTGLEFGRTIAGNIMTPLQNLTQSLLTLGHVNPKNWLAAVPETVSMLGKPQEWERLRRLGVVSRRTKADDELLEQMGQKRRLGKAIEAGSWAFRGTENLNRAHAFYAGLGEAANKGLTGAAAEKFAKDVVRKAQFVFGPEDASEWSRAVRNPAGRGLLQYKSFPAKYGIAMKNFIKDDIKDIPQFAQRLAQGDILGAIEVAPTRFAKVAGATGGLFGAGTVIPGADELLGLDPESLVSTGLVGAMGIAMGHSVGLGTIPIDSIRSLTFFLPGPLVTHFLDAASAGASLATGSQINLDLPSIIKGEGGKQSPLFSWSEIDPELTTKRIVQSIPIAGIQLDRVRQGVLHAISTAPEAQRRPATAAEAVGLRPMGPTHARLRETPGTQLGEAARIGMGLRSPRSERISKIAAKLQADTKLDADSARRAAELLVTGNVDQANAIIERRGMPPGPGAIGEAIKRGVMPPEIRRGLRAPMMLRGPYLQSVPPLPGRPREEQ